MKKHLFLTALVLALVFCLSCGAFAATQDIVQDATPDDANEYIVKANIVDGIDTDTLYIGTVKDWKANGCKIAAKDATAKTFFVNGEALHDNDIIIANGKIGVVLAVGTRNPWGYPAGSILDAGYFKDSKPARDNVWAIELLAHRWDSWAPDNCGKVQFEIVDYKFDGTNAIKAVKVSRIYNVEDDFEIITYYGIAPGEEHVVNMFSEVIYKGESTKGVKLKNDIAITNKGDDGAFMINKTAQLIAGNYSNTQGQESSTFIAYPDGVGVYDKGSLGYKELVEDNTYKKGDKKVLKHFIVIDDEASTAAVNEFLNEYTEAETMTVNGTVKDSNETAVANPVVVVEKGGKPYGWYLGNENGEYSIVLPKDEYELFVERDGYAAGEKVPVEAPTVAVAADTEAAPVVVNQDLVSGAEKVNVEFVVTGKGTAANAVAAPIYSKIELNVPDTYKTNGKVATWKSAYPTVRFCGEAVYNDEVTEADVKGKVYAEVAPGAFQVEVYGEGFWFYTDPVVYDGVLDGESHPAETAKDIAIVYNTDGSYTVTIPAIELTYALDEGWLSGDLHHHANKNDAFAFPKDAVASMAAAGLDVAFITDHDFTVNNEAAYEFSKIYGLEGFIPSEEISCSWAHFNVIPLDKASYDYFMDENQENHVMNQFAQLPTFVEQTHKKGAAITANHPWYSYGLFYAESKDKVPGGYTDEFDNIEINASATNEENLDAIVSTTELWSAYAKGAEAIGDVKVEKAHYLVGGSDTHDVLYPGFADEDLNNTLRSSTDYVTGKIRTIAYAGTVTKNDLPKTGLAYAKAVVEGNSYVTYGPLLDISKDQLPGKTYAATKDQFTVSMGVDSLEAIQDIIVLSEYAVEEYDFGYVGANTEATVNYDSAASMLGISDEDEVYHVDFEATVNVPKTEKTWVAVMVIDVNGSYAISNPYWVTNKDSKSDLADDAWFTGYMLAAVSNGLIQGYPDGTLKAEKAITRAEFAQLVYNYVGDADAKVDDCGLTDVKGHWAEEAIDYLFAEEVITGYPDKTYLPDQTITRAEIATILYKVTGLDAFDGTFDDVKAGTWYYDAVTTLAALGIVNGVGNDLFAPDATAIRAEAITMMVRLVLSGLI